jgi:hypothetical protein
VSRQVETTTISSENPVINYPTYLDHITQLQPFSLITLSMRILILYVYRLHALDEAVLELRIICFCFY